MKKKDMIIDGWIFARSILQERIISEDEDMAGMNLVISHVKQTGLYHLGSMHPENYYEQIIDAELLYALDRKGSSLTAFFNTVQVKKISINRELLERLYKLPSDGLILEELESFWFDELSKAFVENQTGALEKHTSLRFWVMVAIMSEEKVNWCQISLKRLQEEASKLDSARKSFGLILNHILTSYGIQ
ncbi:hypothetical protein OROMI_011588 [Orobanche minor]